MKDYSVDAAERIVELEKLVQSVLENATLAKNNKTPGQLSSDVTNHFGLSHQSPSTKKGSNQEQEYKSNVEIRKRAKKQKN